MNLDACTPGQRASVEHVEGPLLVSAGAGSGKTFTLTQRIAYALLPDSGPAADGIDEVLAITFTEKAASEIKARVKRTLRAEGLGGEALKVDGAWISTIHGMCARILRAHALELGIDPAFRIVGDAQRADLLETAIDAALSAGGDAYRALLDEYKARSRMPNETSVASMVEALIDKAAGQRGGIDALDFGPTSERASVLARDLLLAYEEAAGALAGAGGSATAERARAQAADAASALEAFLAGGVGEECAEGDGADVALRALAGIVDADCARIGGNFAAVAKPAVRAFQAVYDRVVCQIALGLARPFASALVDLAADVSFRYEEAKREACALDNDDLLSRTLEALEGHPDIARRYEQRFKLVMVDEFQDTSQLQIDMIARLAGPNLSRLCTVGDAQQSIYRFRGADVGVYEEHKRVMCSEAVGARYVELNRNFRSHADVLSFVDRVFEQPHVFGSAFMSLSPCEARVSRYRGRAPRIDLVLAELPPGRGTGVGAADAKRACARAVARRFAALKDDGHAAGEMVVLLGKMSRAGLYADALREEGFECVIAGGSLFASAPEVRVVERLLEAVANPANTSALFEVLASDLARLSADDFLELSTEEDPETGQLRRRDLDKGLARLVGREDGLSPSLAHALRLIDGARHAIRTRPASEVLREAVVRSGWMARLERKGACGVACAANVLKAIRLVEEIERARPLGPASVARAFSDELDAGLKEAPGALSGADGDVVKIMTIHASKGLEFPIVALADFADAGRAGSKLVVEACGEVVRGSLMPGSTLDAFPRLAKRVAGAVASSGGDEDEDSDVIAARRFVEGGVDASCSCSQAAYRSALIDRAACEELAEARRKLYVGLTRASEALVVAMDAKAPSPGKPFSYAPLVDDIRSALCGVEDFPEGEAELAYGGTRPARFERIAVRSVDVLPAAGDADVRAASDAATQRFFVPSAGGRARIPRLFWGGGREDVFSYSSIAPAFSSDSFDGASEGDADIEGTGALGGMDADRATRLGAAFHRAAQQIVETGGFPDAAHLDALKRSFGLSLAQRARLEAACARWLSSATFAEAFSWPMCRAEVPFLVTVGGARLAGAIDLLCSRGACAEGRALVVDYKTGGRGGEPLDSVRERHGLQAACYAFALLRSGFEEVELRFVRVERETPDGDLEEVRYRFAISDLADLEARILAARKRS
ncbi:DNA helicase UvrD [Gordonibacter sp. An230]|uniref:UvrD-helicase domain-containing protein n=1 Tax=Gordonibacter sp. An230 TaxID=1965592 RepID=UPI000B3877FD|nr:UvrD-helicase domain-containing protein [Gordonibacter sp. An230]OUO90876.1 DNA helicase UvrD [Gordonibacter sp. An230]